MHLPCHFCYGNGHEPKMSLLTTLHATRCRTPHPSLPEGYDGTRRCVPTVSPQIVRRLLFLVLGQNQYNHDNHEGSNRPSVGPKRLRAGECAGTAPAAPAVA